jgi:hypothetical protein
MFIHKTSVACEEAGESESRLRIVPQPCRLATREPRSGQAGLWGLADKPLESLHWMSA